MQHKLAIGERFKSLCEIENCIDIKDINNNENSLLYSNGFGLNKDELNHIEEHTNFISSNQYLITINFSRDDKKKIGVLFAPIPKSTALLEIKQALITMAEQG